ncbi:uncharacterized protein LOC142338438 isoform X3 [Convolutriloba macropyga]|uniref:uncharacterized protein LOC142338438 isoform X3 n=1 Tax=Convolutriloba macropyga TaxID=536237 RepID=UPI003F520D37
MCKCCGCGRSMAIDQRPYSRHIGRFDECCHERAFSFTLTGIVFAAWTFINSSSLLPRGETYIGLYPLRNEILQAVVMYNESSPLSKREFIHVSGVSLEVGKVTRLLHLWAILGSVVCVGVWCYLGLFRKYKEQNKGIKTLIIIYNTATEMCLVLCTLVWCVNLGDQITQKAYPLLLASATATFTVSFLSSWALLIVPNKVIGNTHTQLSQTPSVEKITVHRL